MMEGAQDAQDPTDNNIEVSQTNPSIDTPCFPLGGWPTPNVDREAERIRSTQDPKRMGLGSHHSEDSLPSEHYRQEKTLEGDPHLQDT